MAAYTDKHSEFDRVIQQINERVKDLGFTCKDVRSVVDPTTYDTILTVRITRVVGAELNQGNKGHESAYSNVIER